MKGVQLPLETRNSCCLRILKARVVAYTSFSTNLFLHALVLFEILLISSTKKLPIPSLSSALIYSSCAKEPMAFPIAALIFDFSFSV